MKELYKIIKINNDLSEKGFITTFIMNQQTLDKISKKFITSKETSDINTFFGINIRVHSEVPINEVIYTYKSKERVIDPFIYLPLTKEDFR